MRKIKTIEELKKICTNAVGDLFILLKGHARSSKNVQYWPSDDSWNIYNCIDDSEEDYGSTEEFKEGYPLFFDALEIGALYEY